MGYTTKLELPIKDLSTTDLVCFSHLRWDFVYQRPQHLLSRFVSRFRVFYIEEPIFHDGADGYDIKFSKEKVWVISPKLMNKDSSEAEIILRQKTNLNRLFAKMEIENYVFWYYTPMALKISDHFFPQSIIYDCMDELSNFKFAPAELKKLEEKLFLKADLVFTGGHSLYEAKQNCHLNIHPFPSSIDKDHFSKARADMNDPADQALIPHLRIGFYGVIDERFNINLLAEVAQQRPDWHFILIGPVVKINPDDLPILDNIHYLGGKSYTELPSYLSGWDITMIPFEKNESTMFISPTKTPEYLAAGKPVISSSIRDVVTPYGEQGLVHIADTPAAFIEAVEKEISTTDKTFWSKKVDTFLAQISWDKTWTKMMYQVELILPATKGKVYRKNLEKEVA
ncbi:MAG: glycosyltransferase family 1 protein [Ferruginibacter sp.]